MITLSTQLVISMSPAFVCFIYLLLLIPLTIPFCWSAYLSGLEFMALYLLGVDLSFLTGHSVWNVLVNFHSLTTVATVYLKALFWDLSSLHCILLRWAHSFLHSDLIIIYMLMTPSCSYPSRQPSPVITFPVCRLILAPSQTGWPQICFVSTAQRLNSCCWVSSLNWIKYKVLHFVWVMVSLFFLQPQIAISVLFLIPILPLLTRSLPFLAGAAQRLWNFFWPPTFGLPGEGDMKQDIAVFFTAIITSDLD